AQEDRLQGLIAGFATYRTAATDGTALRIFGVAEGHLGYAIAERHSARCFCLSVAGPAAHCGAIPRSPSRAATTFAGWAENLGSHSGLGTCRCDGGGIQ